MTNPNPTQTDEQVAKDFLNSHGLYYKARNPVEHMDFEPDCGSCHHIDILCLEAGLAQLLTKTREEGHKQVKP